MLKAKRLMLNAKIENFECSVQRLKQSFDIIFLPEKKRISG